MISDILCYFLAIPTLSSAGIIPQQNILMNPIADVNNSPSLSTNYQVGESPFITLSTPAPPTNNFGLQTETHTVAKEDTTLTADLFGITVDGTSERSTLRKSNTSDEVIDEASRTITEQLIDGTADVLHVDTQKIQYESTSPVGVNDAYVMQELNSLYAVSEPTGDNHMYGLSSNNQVGTVSNPYGLDQMIVRNEDHTFRASETPDGMTTTGNTVTDLSYTVGKDNDVESLYLIREEQEAKQESNNQGLVQSNVQTNIVGIGYADEVSESLTFNQNDQRTSLATDGVQTTVNITKKDSKYNSIDWDGNEEVILADVTNHNIEVQDGDIRVTLNNNDVNTLEGTGDNNGVTSAYKSNQADRTLTISDGDVTQVVQKNNVDVIYSLMNEDGSEDVFKVNESGKTTIVDDKEKSVLTNRNEINTVDGTVDGNVVRDAHSSNQVDNMIVVADNEMGQGLKTSTIDEVYAITDPEGNVEVIKTGGTTVSQAVVFVDDGRDYDGFWMEEAPRAANEVYMSEVQDTYISEAMSQPSNYGSTTESPRRYELQSSGNTYHGPSAGMVIINEGPLTFNQNPESKEAQPPSSGVLGELINQIENLYNENQLTKLRSIFGGGPKVDVEIKLNMKFDE